jgi:putative ABC transport system ATP-binding protein
VDAPRPAALSIRALRKSFPDPEGGRVLVVDLDRLEIPAGETVALMGESGSGKTTLLHLVAGILPADAGTIEVAGEPMTGRTESARDRLRASRIGYLFQTFNLLHGLTARENVELGMSFRPRAGTTPRQAAALALGRVGLETFQNQLVERLSAGQQQRVAIARALAGRPALVLADEPTASLDAANAARSIDLLLSFAGECGAAVLVVTHDAALAARMSRTVTLRGPRVGART